MENKYPDTTTTDMQLVESLQQRQLSAFEDFYNRYAPALYGTIKKSLRKEDVAKETLVETFKVIWGSIDKFNPSKDRLFTWSAKIARKEINKQKIELVLKQLFSCKHEDVVM